MPLSLALLGCGRSWNQLLPTSPAPLGALTEKALHRHVVLDGVDAYARRRAFRLDRETFTPER